MQAEREGGALRGAIDAGLALPWDRLWRPVRRAAAWVMSLPFWLVFGVLLGGQWAVVGIVASVAQHNGFSFYSGGDDSWYYTSAWVLGHGHLPHAAIGYGVPILVAPLAAIAGPNLVAGLPLIVSLNMLVLWPIALLAVYGIAKTIGGRGYAYLATATWVTFPLISIPFFYERYHDRLVGQALPQALGLVATADFPSMVALLVATYFTLRTLSTGDRSSAVVAGLATGFALAFKPSNLIYVAAPIAALAVARRPRELALLAAGLAPALVGLAVWKERGLGSIPAFSHSAVALAVGASTPPLASLGAHHYLDFNWAHLRDNMYFVREYTRSLRMVTWVLVAGIIALWRRSAAIGVLFGVWLASFIVLKGTSLNVNVSDGSFFRLMIPAFPAFFFELVALPLLVPVFGRRLAAAGRVAAAVPDTPRRRSATLWTSGVLTALPVLLIAVLPPLASATAVGVPTVDQYAAANTFPLVATPRPGGTVVLRWPNQDAGGARVGYTVFREPWDGLRCIPGAHGGRSCTFFSDPRTSMRLLSPVALSPTNSYRDRPGPGHWIYRVAATVGLEGPTQWGNFMAFSRRAAANVSR